MDDTLVSARVPKAQKEAAADMLAAKGRTMSDLINSAIDAFVDAGAWPTDAAESVQRSKSDFEAFVKRSTLDIGWPANAPANYKNLEREWRLHDYESLA